MVMCVGKAVLGPLVVALAGCASMSTVEVLPTTAHRVIDDRMNVELQIVSVPIVLPKQHVDVRRATAQLGATMSRTTGRATILLTHRIEHRHGRWLFPSGATYIGLDGRAQRASDFSRERGDVSNCSAIDSCLYREASSFTIDENILRAMAQANGPTKTLPVRIYTERGYTDFEIGYGAVIDLLEGISAERVRLKVP